MKKLAYLCLFSLLITACDNSEEVIQLNPTEMEVRVLDDNGNIVPNAEVKIFRNERDWRMLTREVDTQITDQTGVAYFTDLLPVNYFYFVSFERNGRLYTNQIANLEFGEVGGSNYVLADFLTDNAITRVTVSAIYEKLRGSEITEVILSDVNLFLVESFGDEFAEEEPIILNLGTLLDYDPFFDDLDEALFDDLTFYDEIELSNLTKSDVGVARDYFENFDFSTLTIQEFNASSFVFYEYDEEFFFSEYYQELPVEFTDFTIQNVMPHSLILGDLQFGDDIYSVELILDYQ